VRGPAWTGNQLSNQVIQRGVRPMRLYRVLAAGVAVAFAFLPLLSTGCCCCSGWNKAVQQGIQQAAEQAEKEAKEGQQAQDDMRDIGTAYQNYANANGGRPPSRADELRPFLVGNAMTKLQSNRYTVIWGVRAADVEKTPAGKSGTILG